jgi:hypothetical protein
MFLAKMKKILLEPRQVLFVILLQMLLLEGAGFV